MKIKYPEMSWMTAASSECLGRGPMVYVLNRRNISYGQKCGPSGS